MQTLGVSHPRYMRMAHTAAWILAAVVVAGQHLLPAGGARRVREVAGPPVKLDARIPAGPIEKKWDEAPLRDEAGEPRQQAPVHRHRGRLRAWPAAAAAATLAELGYNVKCFCYQDSPRRAHSIAAQGGINAAKNYQNDGDSIFRLFYDTVKGGDFRSREANVYRLAEDQREHHRPVRRPGRAFRPRVRRHCSTTAPSAARRSRARSTRAARPASSSCSAPTRPWSARSASARSRCSRATRCSSWSWSTAARAASSSATWSPGEIESHVARRGHAWRPAATATSSTSPPTPRAATPPRSGAPTRRARPSRTPASRRSTPPASR